MERNAQYATAGGGGAGASADASAGGDGPSTPRVGDTVAAAANSAFAGRVPTSSKKRAGSKLKLKRRRRSDGPTAAANAAPAPAPEPAAEGMGRVASCAVAENDTPPNANDDSDRGPQPQLHGEGGGDGGGSGVGGSSSPPGSESSQSSQYFTPAFERDELRSSKLTVDDVIAIESSERTAAALAFSIEGGPSPTMSLEKGERKSSPSNPVEEGRCREPLDVDEGEQDDVDSSGMAQQPLTQPASPAGSGAVDSSGSDGGDDESLASADGSSAGRRPSHSSVPSSHCGAGNSPPPPRENANGHDNVVDSAGCRSEPQMNSCLPSLKDAFVIEEIPNTYDNGPDDGTDPTGGASMEVSDESYPLLTQPIPPSDKGSAAESDSDAFMQVDDGYSAIGVQEENESDNHSSCSSSSASSSDQSTLIDKDLRDINTTCTPRIVRNRRRNIKRNEERLRILMRDVGRPEDGEDQQVVSATVAAAGGEGRAKNRVEPGVDVDETTPQKNTHNRRKRRGMLIATDYNGLEQESSSVGAAVNHPLTPTTSPGGASKSDRSVTDEVSLRFPHRHPQIRMLCSIFTSTIQQSAGIATLLTKMGDCADAEHCSSYVPPPIFITGPCGAGKTSVVRDIVQTLRRRHKTSAAESERRSGPRIGEGYVDCAMIEGSSAGVILESAYKQILRSFHESYAGSSTRKSKKRKRSKKKENGDTTSSNRTIKSFSGSFGPIGGQNIEDGGDASRVDGTSLSEPSEPSRRETEQDLLHDSDELTSVAMFQSNSVRDADGMQPGALVIEDARLCLNDEAHGNDAGYNSDEELADGDMEDEIERQKNDHLRSKSSAVHRKKFPLTALRTSSVWPSDADSSSLVPGDISGREGKTGRQVRTTGAPQSTTLEMSRHHAINTPVELGRALSPLCGGLSAHGARHKSHGCAFLILDHGERLLSLTAKQSSPYTSISSGERNNLLAQLLLLPKVMDLNLTVIVITTNSLLEFSRTNNIHSQPHLSLGTIQDAIHPIRIRFHAYRGKEMYKSILVQPRMRQLVIGYNYASDSHGSIFLCQIAQKKRTAALGRLYNAMINTIIQSLEGATRDVREMLRFSRILWPIYTSPLLASCHNKFRQFILNVSAEESSGQRLFCDEDCSFCRTAASITADDSSVEEVIEHLDIKARPQIRTMLKKCLFTPIQKLDASVYPSCLPTASRENKKQTTLASDTMHTASKKQMSYMAKFLLLSAFLCQNNKQDQDLTLFTSHNKGRRKKGRGGGNVGDLENVAYASSAAAQQQLRMLRPTSFPMERMLSIFSTILSKYGSQSVLLKNEIQEDGYINVSKVGTARLFECLAELRDFGLLREMSGTSGDSGLPLINMSTVKYFCNLSLSDAQEVAKDLNFPLSKFLLQG